MLGFSFGIRKDARRAALSLAAITSACAAMACTGATTSSSQAPAPALQAEALAVYHDRCAPCHGVLGKGNGPDAGKLKRRPVLRITWLPRMRERVGWTLGGSPRRR